MTNRTLAKRIGALIAGSSALAMAVLTDDGPAVAADIRLLSAAAMQTVFKETVDEFERRSGHRLIIHYATMGAITQILPGERADLVISSSQSVAELARQGRIRAGSQVTICRTGVGVVVPRGGPKPAMTSVEDFKRALLDARVVLYANPVGGGAAGVHVARVIEQLGIAEQLKAKTKFGAGGDVAELTLAEGPGALGITQNSEIVGKATVDYAGPLPKELQNYTEVVAGIPSDASDSDAGRAFIRFLQSPAAVAVIKAKGMDVE